jgi:DNA polymerase alpha subunit A
MGWEYPEKELWSQLLYLRSLFDVERAVNPTETTGEVKIEEEEKAKMKVLASQNRERFGTVEDVVGKWLERNGRQWVQMDSLFGFAIKA